MRSVIPALCLVPLVSVALTQTPVQTHNVPVKVRTLTIISKDLPQAEKAQINHALQGKIYLPEEIAKHVRLKLYDLGYARATVDPPQLSAFLLAPTQRTADVLIRVNPGAKYRLDAIRIVGNATKSKERILEQIPIHPGDAFDASAIGRSLDNVKNLYTSEGYINFGAIPQVQYDDANQAAALTIVIDEGNKRL